MIYFQNNRLVSSDNKGMAAYLAESAFEPDPLPGNTNFMAVISLGKYPWVSFNMTPGTDLVISTIGDTRFRYCLR